MRARMALRPLTVDRHIAPTAAPTPHGSPRSMLPAGADGYSSALTWGRIAPSSRALRMGDYHDPGFFWYRDLSAGCHPMRPYGQLYPPPEAIRGPFTSPPFHLRLGDDVAPGAPATSVTYPDILTSGDQVAVPALSQNEPFTQVTPVAPEVLRALRPTTPGTVGSAQDWRTLLLYAGGGLAALLVLTRLGRR